MGAIYSTGKERMAVLDREGWRRPSVWMENYRNPSLDAVMCELASRSPVFRSTMQEVQEELEMSKKILPRATTPPPFG